MIEDSGRPGGLSSQATEPQGVSAVPASIPDAFAVMDDWCRARASRLTEKAGSHVMAGQSLDAPRYRMLLGEHRAFMAMRSFIHGSRAAQETKKDGRNEPA